MRGAERARLRYNMPMAEGRAWDGFRKVGPHLFRVERPDIVHVRLQGPVEGAHVGALLDEVADVVTAKRLYILRDARAGGSPSRSAREFVVRDPRVDKLAALVTYGAGYRDRVLLGMMDKALRVLRPQSPRVVVFETEAEARAFIEADRERERTR